MRLSLVGAQRPLYLWRGVTPSNDLPDVVFSSPVDLYRILHNTETSF